MSGRSDHKMRKPYLSPQVTDYGNLSELTRAKGTVGKDNPLASVKTKSTGGG
jgi:hypothetical protein